MGDVLLTMEMLVAMVEFMIVEEFVKSHNVYFMKETLVAMVEHMTAMEIA